MSQSGEPTRDPVGRVGGSATMVTVGAALWGTDALFRFGLSERLPAATVVFAQHVVLVLITGIGLPSALAVLARSGWRTAVAAAVLGIGSSAGATMLFTMALSYGDPVTPALLQKAQPLLAVAAAWLFLGERPRRSYWPFLLLALAGTWLVAFPNPLSVAPTSVVPALLGLGAALLWGLGTVLGRYLLRELTDRQVTSLRFGGGFVASGLMVLCTSAPVWPTAGGTPAILCLALVPGLLAVAIYYRGLQRTPAMVATVCELAFPLTAALVGVLALDASMTAGQIVGTVVLALAVVALTAVNERVVRRGARKSVETDPVRDLAVK